MVVMVILVVFVVVRVEVGPFRVTRSESGAFDRVSFSRGGFSSVGSGWILMYLPVE